MFRRIDYLLSLCVIFLAVSWGPAAPLDEYSPARSEAQALLLLCRLPDTVTPQGTAVCLSDPIEAKALAQLQGKPLFTWVGGCDPELRECFPEAIHLHADDWEGDRGHQLLVPGESGWVYRFRNPTKAAAPAVRGLLQRLKGKSFAGCSGGSCR